MPGSMGSLAHHRGERLGTTRVVLELAFERMAADVRTKA
jgi:hypothetical protein